MTSVNQLLTLVSQWAAEGLEKIKMVVKIAEATIGWPYVWGATGAACTPAKRRYYMNREVCPSGDKEFIRKTCPVLAGTGSCDNCKFRECLINDCQGWVKYIFKLIGITLTGGGCTSMWNTKSLWSSYGTIDQMPEGCVCLVFKQNPKDKKTMEHIGLCVDGLNIIHCSGTVKRGKTTDGGSLKWSHYAIPKGLEGGIPVPTPTPTPTRATIRKGSKGEDVRYAQQKLIALGYDLGSYGADGSFGAKTEAAVKAFQQAKGLKADGIVGKDTWAALEDAKPDEKPIEYYTVTIPHLPKDEAEALKVKYSGSTIAKE